LIFKKVSLFFCFVLWISSQLYSQTNLKMDRHQRTYWQWQSPAGSYAIHYIEKGAGPHHIVLLHGFAAHSFTWRFVIDDLVKAGYHVWSIDLLGSGFSDKPLHLRYHLDLFINQIEAFMQAKQIPQAALIGNSMGGGLALAISIKYPHRVQSLVLIDALAFPIKLPFYFATTRLMGKWTKPFIGKAMTKQILKQVMYDPQKISEEQIDAYVFPFHTPGGKDAFIKTIQNFNPRDLESLALHFKEIKVPLLIIWGEKDSWMPLPYFKRLSQAFPQATTVVIPHCGHIPQEECPVEVNKVLLQFLGQPLAKTFKNQEETTLSP
jgi:pimeloyl-ACP methyl ester carboxylesterase